jgi:serine/threonine protein kinase/tetratricopeptide (TPR) repeat protein
MKSPNDNRSIAHYRLLDRLGEGAMGIVYKAEDTRLGRTVALKLLAERLRDDPASLERFLREARAAARVNHPNVCMIFDVHDATTGDEPFIAMEFIEGITLRGCIEGHRREGGLLPVEVVASYATQIALGLDAAHRSGIIHRDVKSENIMLDAGSRVKVMDFGLARHEGAERLTRESSMMGTIAYMAPEVIQGSEPDARSDIFSFGVVLYEMLTGRLPFRGVHEPAMMYSIMHEAPAPLAMHREGDVGVLARVVERALAKDREQRYGSVAEILEELEPGRGTVVERTVATPARSPSRSLSSSGRRTVSGSVRESQSGVQSAELRLYISGASEDLHEEREYLMKKVFPELRVVCREQGITFTEVDLRWGLTDEEVSDGRIIHACLEEIDRCRPYFIGIIGESYGAIPSFNEIQKYPALLEAYPWIEEAALDGMSITEIEAQYAVLGVGTDGIDSESRDDSTFYFRRQRTSLNEVGVESAERRRLEAFQQRVRQSGAHIEEYRDASLLGEQIYDQLIAIIKRDFADATAPTPLETERMRHTAFAQSRRRAYIANPLYLKQLNDHVASDNPPLVVYAESGSGKSSLFAYWAQQYRRKHPESHVIEHYVGIGATATDHYAIIRHFCLEVKERFGREEEIPSEPAKLDLALGQWLGYADHELKKRGQRMVLIIDGLNQLQGTALNLKWIPDVISPTIRLIVSSTVEGMFMELQKRGWSRFGMQALSEAERETIVVRYLAEYHKSLNAEQVKRIVSDYKCGHPLFLKTVLEELRLVGRHEELDAKIESYLEATGTEDLFQRVLERLEEDYNMRAVRDVMTLLSASRSGLDERELSDISGMARLKIATMMAGLDYHLVRKEGRLTFFHDYLRRAVQKRYLSDVGKTVQAHERLAGYFERAAVSLRATREVVHALESLGERARLEGVLTEIARFEEMWRAEREEVLRLWSSAEATAVAGAYSAGLERWQQQETPGEERRAAVLGAVADLLELVGAWRQAEQLQRERMEVLRGLGDRSEESRALSKLANLSQLLGRMEEAEGLAREAEGIAGELGDRQSIAIAVGTRGSVHRSRGEYAEAIACYAEWEEIARELGDRWSISTAVGNRGIVHWSRGEYAEALACYAQQEQIARELGNRQSTSLAVGNRGIVHESRGEYAKALACFREQEEIARELGDRRNIAHVVGNRGVVYGRRAEYAEALACFREQEEIAREIGDRWGISTAVGNRGSVHFDRGEHAEALACFVEKEEIAREIGTRYSIAVAVCNRGTVHIQRGEYAEALACFHEADTESRAIDYRDGRTYCLEGTARVLLECAEAEGEMQEYLPAYVPGATAETWRAMSLRAAGEAAAESQSIAQELSKPDTLFSSQVLLARIKAAGGGTDVAMQRLYGLLEEATDDDQRAELRYWLWKLGAVSHAATALGLYKTLYANTPKHEYKKRIDELRAAEELS